MVTTTALPMDNDKAIDDYYKQITKHFQGHGRTKEFVGHTSKVHSVGWNCSGRLLASCSFDKTVSIFTLEKDRIAKECTMKGHSDSVDCLCWHPSNSNLLVTASGDKTIRVWGIHGARRDVLMLFRRVVKISTFVGLPMVIQ